MSDKEGTERSVRIIPFNGKKSDWRIWSRRFLAAAGKKKYKNVLLGIEAVPADSEVLDESKDKEKLKARKANIEAYHDLVLANSEVIPFNIIDMSVTVNLPDGDANLAWKRLNAKYESKTNVSLTQLQLEFSESELTDVHKDPEEWMTELEVIQSRLKSMNYEISEEQLIIHVLNHLPEEYDIFVDAIERDIDFKNKSYDYDEIKEMICSKYEKLMRRSGKNNKEPDSALSVVNSGGKRFKKQFKGRCYNCGKIGHKGVDCWELGKNKDKRPSNWSSNFRNNVNNENSSNATKNRKSFNGFCYVCGKRGHRSSECTLRKTEAIDENAFSVNDDEGVALFSFCPCIDYNLDDGTQENTTENDENVEVVLDEPIVYSSVVELTNIV